METMATKTIKHALRVLLLVVVLFSVVMNIYIPKVAASTFGLTSTGTTSYPTAKAVTANGNTQVDTAQSKFGGASGLFDGATDYLSLADSADWYFGTGAFTIDFWVMFNSLPANTAVKYLVNQYVDANNRWWTYLYNNSGTYQWAFMVKDATVSTVSIVKSSPGVLTATWYHVAFVRSGNSWYIFQGGTQVGTTVTDADQVPDLAASLRIGAYPVAGQDFNGWFEDFRISNVARWTTTFTPSTTRYDRDSSTVYLDHMDLATGEVDGSTVFLDDVTTGLAKATKFTLTETGTPSSMSFYSHAAGNIRLAIYSDSSGPSSDLCETADTVVTATAWTSPNISCPSLSAADYWLVWQWNPGTAYVAGSSYNSTAGSGNYIYQAYGAFPASWTGGTVSTEQWSIYVTYTAGGGSTTTTTTGTSIVSTTVLGTSTIYTVIGTTTSKGTAAATSTQLSTLSTVVSTFTGGTSTIGTVTTTTTSATTLKIIIISYTEQRTVTVNTTYTEQDTIWIVLVQQIAKIMNVSYTSISKVMGVAKANIFAVLGVDPPVNRTKPVPAQSITATAPPPSQTGSWLLCTIVIVIIGTVITLSRTPRYLKPTAGSKNNRTF
jgi:hypothetical protein